MFWWKNESFFDFIFQAKQIMLYNSLIIKHFAKNNSA